MTMARPKMQVVRALAGGTAIPSPSMMLSDARLIQAQVLEDLATLDGNAEIDPEMRATLYKNALAKQEILLKALKTLVLLREETQASARSMVAGKDLAQLSDAEVRELVGAVLGPGTPAREPEST